MLFVGNIVFWGGLMRMMRMRMVVVVVMRNKFVGAGGPVNKLCPDGESHNWAPVKCSAD